MRDRREAGSASRCLHRRAGHRGMAVAHGAGGGRCQRRWLHRRPEAVSRTDEGGSSESRPALWRETHACLRTCARRYAARLDPGQLRAIRAGSIRRLRRAGPDDVLDTTQSSATWGLDRIDQRDAAAQRRRTPTPTPARASPPTSSTPASASPTPSSAAARRRGFDADRRRTRPTTATATARTSRAPSAARPTASPRASSWSPCACSTAAASGTHSGVIAGIDWVTANHRRPGGGEHEPRRRRQRPRSTRPSATRSPPAWPTRSRPATTTRTRAPTRRRGWPRR